MRKPTAILILCLWPMVANLPAAADTGDPQPASPWLVVLGIAQDGGVPQAGSKDHPAWDDPGKRRLATSLALVDPESSQRWLFDATPDFRKQLHRLDVAFPVAAKPGLAGIFLTHAHMGHYTGLMHLGHEAMGAKEVPVHAMPRMHAYLESNGPWSQLVRYGNIALSELHDREAVELNQRLQVTPILVPHRQEFSEVVGYRIVGPKRSVLFIPDIDSWELLDELGTAIEELIASVDVAYLDATFFDEHEMPGRDMSGFPHPFITHSMKRFAPLPKAERAKVRFIHLNHTNPALEVGSEAQKTIESNGFRVAVELERIEL